eukprot:1984560-Rhodomonas_salina.1
MKAPTGTTLQASPYVSVSVSESVRACVRVRVRVRVCLSVSLCLSLHVSPSLSLSLSLSLYLGGGEDEGANRHNATGLVYLLHHAPVRPTAASANRRSTQPSHQPNRRTDQQAQQRPAHQQRASAGETHATRGITTWQCGRKARYPGHSNVTARGKRTLGGDPPGDPWAPPPAPPLPRPGLRSWSYTRT